MYKQAIRLKLRFQTPKGLLTIEQLWSLSITDLDKLAVAYREEYESSGRKSFLVKSSAKDKTAKLKMDIVVDILLTMVEEQAALEEANENKQHNKRILELISEKKDESLKGKSLKELEAMLK